MLEGRIAAELRRALRFALLRHETVRAAGHQADTAREIAARFLASLAGEPAAAGPDAAVADMGLRATLAATIMAEVEVTLPRTGGHLV